MTYEGKLESGEVFDASQGYPFKFTLGKGAFFAAAVPVRAPNRLRVVMLR